MRSRIDLNPMRAFDSSDPGTQAVMRDAPKLLDRLDPDDAEHFAQVRALLDDAGIRYELDPTLVRGLDYYTRTVFEFTSDELGAQSGVGGGGRYDGLIELLDGPPTPGVGLGGRQSSGCCWPRASSRRAPSSSTCSSRSPGPRRRAPAFELAREARRAGLQAQLELAGRSLKGQLRHADRIGARYVAIIGDNGTATLKNMESGEQRGHGAGQNVIPAILRERRRL